MPSASAPRCKDTAGADLDVAGQMTARPGRGLAVGGQEGVERIPPLEGLGKAAHVRPRRVVLHLDDLVAAQAADAGAHDPGDLAHGRLGPVSSSMEKTAVSSLHWRSVGHGVASQEDGGEQKGCVLRRVHQESYGRAGPSGFFRSVPGYGPFLANPVLVEVPAAACGSVRTKFQEVLAWQFLKSLAKSFPTSSGRFPRSSQAAAFRPFIPAEVRLRELTPIPLIVGTILGIIFGASSLYLVLKVGLTVSASIPVAVISLTIFRLLGSSAWGRRSSRTTSCRRPDRPVNRSPSAWA